MICEICKIKELTGMQKKYCSIVCQRKASKIRNREAILLGKRRYRQTHKDELREYNRKYRKRVASIRESLAHKLKSESPCLRCDTRLNLEVHHIKRQDLGGGANDINNIVVLCKNCHALWHSMFPIEYWLYGKNS